MAKARSGRKSAARRSYGGSARSGGYRKSGVRGGARRSTRRAPSRRSSSAPRTLRIVVETAAPATAIARPDLTPEALATAQVVTKAKKARF